jgi:hypothetical protein
MKRSLWLPMMVPLELIASAVVLVPDTGKIEWAPFHWIKATLVRVYLLSFCAPAAMSSRVVAVSRMARANRMPANT